MSTGDHRSRGVYIRGTGPRRGRDRPRRGRGVLPVVAAMFLGAAIHATWNGHGARERATGENLRTMRELAAPIEQRHAAAAALSAETSDIVDAFREIVRNEDDALTPIAAHYLDAIRDDATVR